MIRAYKILSLELQYRLAESRIFRVVFSVVMPYTECRFAGSIYAECRYAECRYAGSIYAECCYAGSIYAECHHEECVMLRVVILESLCSKSLF